MAFSTEFRQRHFIVYELVLPYCSVCTPVYTETEKWHTPLTCEEASDSEYSLWLTSNRAPLLAPPSASINIKSKLNSSIFKCVSSATESTAKLKPGEGMASRGSMTLTCTDFEADPGPINFSDKGTFFGKLLARNILESKKIISHYYTLAGDSETPVEVSTSTHFIETTTLNNGVFTLKAKDALKDLEAFSEQFPPPSEVTLTSNIDATQTSFTVSDGSKINHSGAIRIDDEIMNVVSIVSDTVTVSTRGATITNVDGDTVYKTTATAHDSDATVQGAWLCEKVFVTDLIYDIFEVAGLLAYEDLTQWNTEVTVWNANAYVVGVFHEPEEVIDVLNELMESYTLDMWLDQPTQKAVISAVSVWKEAGKTLTEEFDFTDLKITNKVNDRYSRAYVNSRKDFKTKSDDKVNYSKLTITTDEDSETTDFYGNIRIKEFEPNDFLNSAGAQTLVTRYVQRFSKTPKEFSFKMEERKVGDLALSDIINIKSRSAQSASGASLETIDRAQVTEIKPDLNDIGRTYVVKALTYVPLIEESGDLTTVFTNRTIYALDLYSTAGSPATAVDWTFVFDNCIIGSDINEAERPAVLAGPWPSGSTITIILTNGSKWSAKGGDSGDAYVEARSSLSNSTNKLAATAEDSTDGKVAFNSSGVTTSIYVNYGVVSGYNTDGQLIAPGGGGASSSAASRSLDGGRAVEAGAAVTGGGGSGIPFGVSGVASSGGGNTSVSSGADGTFTLAGNGSSLSEKGQFAAVIAEVSVSSGAGGASAIGSGSSASIISGDYSLTNTGAAGAAGAAIKGTNVTVYNLAADVNKFKPGNSDSFTLVDV